MTQYPRLEVFECWKRERTMLVVEWEGRLIGYGIARRDRGEIEGVHVLPGEVRKGIGGCVLAGLENAAAGEGIRNLKVTVSLNAVEFYEACGYVRVGSRSSRVRME